MGEFIGQLGGILMIILIAVLLVYFVYDIITAKTGKVTATETVKSSGSQSVLSEIFRFALITFGVMAVYMIAGGLIYNFTADPDNTNILSIGYIWSFKPVAYDEYVGAETFSLYNVFADIFAKLLYDKIFECRLYISLLCGVVTGVSTAFRYKKIFDKEISEKCFLLFMCVPGIMFAFLPSPLSMFIMLFSLCLLADSYNNKILACFCAILSVFVHVSGIAVVVMYIVSIIIDKVSKADTEDKSGIEKKLYIQAITAIAVQIFIAMYLSFSETGSKPEYWCGMLPVVVPLFGTFPFIKKNRYYTLTVTLMTLLSGLYILLKLYERIKGV